MAAHRYLCSHLIRLRAGGGEQWANLEEIWENGAVIDCEEPVAAGAEAAISAEGMMFSGCVRAVESGEFGWRVEMDFAPPMRWTMEQWKPDHALDPASMG